MTKSNLKIIKAVLISEGAGAKVKRSFPTRDLSYIDPFVLMDEFFVGADAGFPEHPHRGFEAITYMLDGGFSHEDTSGAKAIVMEGGVQRITMGKGIWHSEMPATKNLNHGIQLWVNLPQKLKQIDPNYEIYNSDKLPLKSDDKKIIKTIVGKDSPVKLNTDVEYYHVILHNSNYDWNVDSAKNGFIYTISGKGSVNLNSEVIQLEEGVLLLKKDNISSSTNITTKDKINFIVLIGKPHQEPIRQHGSFVD